MENVFVFRKMEVTGATKEEAFDKTPFTAPRDKWVNATQKFNNFKKSLGATEALTEATVRKFMNDYLTEKKIAPGVGCYIVVEAAVADSRQRPYTTEKYKNEGTRELAKVFQLIDDATGKILAETPVTRVDKMVKQVDENGEVVMDEEGNPVKVPALDEDGNVIKVWKAATQADAFELGRKLYENGYTGNLHIDTTKKVVSGTATIGRMTYSPSKNTRPGTYIVFGQEAV